MIKKTNKLIRKNKTTKKSFRKKKTKKSQKTKRKTKSRTKKLKKTGGNQLIKCCSMKKSKILPSKGNAKSKFLFVDSAILRTEQEIKQLSKCKCLEPRKFESIHGKSKKKNLENKCIITAKNKIPSPECLDIYKETLEKIGSRWYKKCDEEVEKSYLLDEKQYEKFCHLSKMKDKFQDFL